MHIETAVAVRHQGASSCHLSDIGYLSVAPLDAVSQTNALLSAAYRTRGVIAIVATLVRRIGSSSHDMTRQKNICTH